MYTRVVIDMESGLVEEASHYEHCGGSVALCKGDVNIPPMPPPPKPPPMPPPPEIQKVEAKARSEYLDKLLLRMRKAQQFRFPGQNALGLGASQGAAAAAMQPTTLLGG